MRKPLAILIHVLLIPARLLRSLWQPGVLRVFLPMPVVGLGGCIWSAPTVMPVVTPVATLTAKTDGMILVYVPAGEFLMGLTSADIDSILTQCKHCKREQFANEQPRHPVYLDAYWIDRTEVTNAMYAACVQAGTCQLPRLISSLKRSSYYGASRYQDYPVIYVDWDQAAAYCAWAGRRLPTEAEWEKAARGTDGRLYPWGNQAPDCNRANFDASSNNIKYCVGETQAVGSYPSGASPYGALDMAGNVWEWVSDYN